MADNLSLQAQLNALFQEQNKVLELQSKMLKDHVSLTRELVANFSKLNFKTATSDIQEMNKAVQEGQRNISGLGEQTGAFEHIKEEATKVGMAFAGLEERAEELTKKYGKLALIGGGVFHGLLSGLKFSTNLFRSVTSGAWGLVHSLTQIGVSILAIPFKMLSGLISMASTGGSNELAQALEDIRKEFGALHETAGAAIISMARSMKGGLAETGLSTYRVFGNLAERLKSIAEYAKQMGPLFEALAPTILKNAERFGAYNKGLGLTEEGLKAVAARAHATGTDITEVQREMANYSLQLGRAFGLSSKMISRDIGTMMADFKHFGGLSTQQLAQVSVYARRLGVEIKSIVGIIERYDNFEDAAKGAAHLSQAFGLNVDALQLMKAQNPAERIEIMRKAFFNAGRSVENMTRQERNLLAQQTGLGEDTLGLVFSLKNAGMSYADIQKKSDAAKRKQLSQAEAMKRLADSIERLVKSGSAMQGGFLDRFIQGFMRGVTWSREFRQLMINLRRTLYDVYRAGIQVGRAFVEAFPGVRDIITALRDLFNPRRFRQLMREVVSSFRQFFQDMTTDPRTALPRLFDRLKTKFFDFFDQHSQNGQRLLGGFRKFFLAIGQIAGGLLRIALKGITEGIRFITDLISGRRRVGGGALAAGATSFVGRLFGPILDAIVDAWPALWQAIKGLFSTIWEKAGPWIKRQVPLVLAVFFGPAVFSGALKGLTAAILPALFGALVRVFTGNNLRQGADIVSKGLGRLTQAATAVPAVGGAGAARNVSQAAGVAEQTNRAGEAVQQSRRTDWRGGVRTVGLMVAFLAVLTAFMWIGFLPLARQMKNIPIGDIIATGLALVTTAMTMVAIAGALRLLLPAVSGISLSTIGRAAAGLAAIGVVAGAMALGAYGLVRLFSGISAGDMARSAALFPIIATFWLAAAGITVLSAAIGAIIGFTGGLGLLAIAAGLATMAAISVALVEASMNIMRTLDSFRPSPGFKDKIEAFVKIVGTVGTFATNLGPILSAARPSIISIIFGNPEEEFRQNLGAITNLISTIGSQITNIIRSLNDTLRAMPGGPEELRKAEVLGNLLTGVGHLAEALKTPTEAFQDNRGWIQRLYRNNNTAQQLETVRNYAQVIGRIIPTFGTVIVNMVRELTSLNLTENQLKAAEILTGVLNAIGTLVKAMVPDPRLIGELNKGRDFFRQVDIIRSQLIEPILRTLVNGDFIQRVGQVITSIASSLTGSGMTKAQLETLKVGMPVLQSTLTTLAELAKAIASIGSEGGARAGGFAGAIDFIGGMLGNLSLRLPQVFSALIQTFTTQRITPAQLNLIKAGMDAVKSIFETVGSLNSVEVPNAGTLETKFFAMGVALSTIQRKVVDLNNQLGGLEGYGGVSGNSVGLSIATADLVRNVANSGLRRTANVVRDMVAQVNQVSTALNGLTPINVQTRLAELGRTLGVGAEGTYRIENRHFNINVNFTVKIDNEGLDALELALIRRPGGTRVTHTETRRS